MSNSSSPTHPSSNHAAWTLLLIAILAGLLLRTITITAKDSISHDESISYLAATANQGVYEAMKLNFTYPYAIWVPAAEWKQFLMVREPFAFQQIGQDLADSDIHPPLYFWLLHLWTMAFGLYIWTGPTLNLLLFVISALALYGLAHRLLENAREAAVVTAVWAVSPALIEITLTTRQYELLGLCTILFIWALVRYADPITAPSGLNWLALVLTVAAGALTHFHFALVVAGAAVIFLLPLYRSAPHRLLTALAAG